MASPGYDPNLSRRFPNRPEILWRSTAPTSFSTPSKTSRTKQGARLSKRTTHGPYTPPAQEDQITLPAEEMALLVVGSCGTDSF